MTETKHPTSLSSSSRHNKDTLYMELRQCRFSSGDAIVIQYGIKNTTKWHYAYLSDGYWMERHVNGEWVRMPSAFGSVLMGKEIPAYGCIHDDAKVVLKTGRYRFCNAVNSDDARIGKKEITLKADFEVVSRN